MSHYTLTRITVTHRHPETYRAAAGRARFVSAFCVPFSLTRRVHLMNDVRAKTRCVALISLKRQGFVKAQRECVHLTASAAQAIHAARDHTTFSRSRAHHIRSVLHPVVRNGLQHGSRPLAHPSLFVCIGGPTGNLVAIHKAKVDSHARRDRNTYARSGHATSPYPSLLSHTDGTPEVRNPKSTNRSPQIEVRPPYSEGTSRRRQCRGPRLQMPQGRSIHRRRCRRL